jgi:hypothetical protein
LTLDGTKITDSGLERLRGMAQLERLWLTHTDVTDAGVEHLSGLVGLKELKLTDTRVTATGVQRLRTALPACRLVAEHLLPSHPEP